MKSATRTARPRAPTTRRRGAARSGHAAAPARAPAVGFVSLGCPKALVDSERIITELRLRGYTIAPEYRAADLVVVNTCGFIDSAIDESLSAIGEALVKRGGAAPARVTQARARRGQKRSAGELDQTLAMIVEHLKSVRATVQQGCSMEHLKSALGVETRALVLPIKKLLADKRIGSIGRKRATRYYLI